MLDYYYQHSPEQRFKDLRLIFCGRESCRPLHSFGPVVRPNYIIHYILEGKGIYRVGDDTFHLHEKEGFLIEPEVLTFYEADKDTPWTYCWVGFDGDLAPVLLSQMGLGGNRLTFCCDRKEELEVVFSGILKNQQHSEVNDLVLESQLYLFFAILMKDMNVAAGIKKPGKNMYVREAIQYIQDNYFHPVKVEDIAACIGIDRSYLYMLFKKEVGMSPSEYLASFRLTRAAQMLKLTDYSVESIAWSCGYQDPLVFSRAFKRKFQETPLRYRNRK